MKSKQSVDQVLFCLEDKVIKETILPTDDVFKLSNYISTIDIDSTIYDILSIQWVQGRALVFVAPRNP